MSPGTTAWWIIFSFFLGSLLLFFLLVLLLFFGIYRTYRKLNVVFFPPDQLPSNFLKVSHLLLLLLLFSSVSHSSFSSSISWLLPLHIKHVPPPLSSTCAPPLVLVSPTWSLQTRSRSC